MPQDIEAEVEHLIDLRRHLVRRIDETNGVGISQMPAQSGSRMASVSSMQARPGIPLHRSFRPCLIYFPFASSAKPEPNPKHRAPRIEKDVRAREVLTESVVIDQSFLRFVVEYVQNIGKQFNSSRVANLERSREAHIQQCLR